MERWALARGKRYKVKASRWKNAARLSPQEVGTYYSFEWGWRKGLILHTNVCGDTAQCLDSRDCF